MIHEIQLRVSPAVAADEALIKTMISQEKGLDEKDICALRILKRSIDARQRSVFVNLKVQVFENEQPTEQVYAPLTYPDVSNGKSVVVVGAGPGGLFAALRLIELGYRPILVERGKNVHDRKKDLALISRDQKIDPESNYSFGEGGAGAYSDGKLYTRSKKRGSVDKVLTVFCQHGANTDIFVDAHPHLGTDQLPRIIENIRKTILSCGGEVRFETCMERFEIKADTVIGIHTRAGEFIEGPVILATGHSARDVYRYLDTNKIAIEAKSIAVGVRLEHPQALIDQLQYHTTEDRGPFLPAAEYRYVTQVKERGVYSFCMCPGGFVVPAATGDRQLVVNGMSPANRGSKWANSGMVVETHLEDIPSFADRGALAMMAFQEQMEELAWINGGMRQVAPAQRMGDFVRGRNSVELEPTSYAPGLLATPLHALLPVSVSSRLRAGFQRFGEFSRGFLTNEATVIGVETRTSSPVRILRDRETLCHVQLKGLYPCGEGAGYAGGIVSAAIDGMRCAESSVEIM
ncbi:MAG: FAD-binding protein [Massilibacteroides sp.]|nr:FAD-binding protein [Massilibacteroides sp.]